MTFVRLVADKIKDFYLKWINIVPNGFLLKQDEATCPRIVANPLTPK